MVFEFLKISGLVLGRSIGQLVIGWLVGLGLFGWSIMISEDNLKRQCSIVRSIVAVMACMK